MRKEEFESPGVEFGEVPFWVWNGKLTDEELLRQVDEFEKAGCRSVFVAPATSLATPYLSGQWMEKVKVVLEAAAAKGMKVWIYDENIYPSGYAEGIVPAQNPDFRIKALMMRSSGRPDKVHEEVAVFECELHDGEIVNPVRIEAGGDAKPDKAYLEFCQYRATIGDSNQAEMCTTDIFNPAAVDAFLECTHENYARHVGKWFGSTIPGFFTDEPEYHTGRRCDLPVVPWTEHMPEHFREMHGYDLREHLPALFLPIGEYHKVRVHFWRCVIDLFTESYTSKVYDWCERHGLKLTGHVSSEDTLASQILAVGSCMPHYEYMHIPGLDQLGLDAPGSMRGDRGIARILTVKQVSSVAAQLGRPRVFCEAYGCSGQNMSFEDRKWIGDWLGVLGVNFFDPHLSLYSLRGNRKRLCPPVLFFQQPWWHYNPLIGDYFSRLSYVLSQGKAVRDVVVIHPMGSAWSVYTPLDNSCCNQIDENLAWLQQTLLDAHRDYDLADEVHIEKWGSVEGDSFVMGQCRYKVVVLPGAVTWSANTVRTLSEFIANGGSVISIEPVATMIDGLPSSEPADLANEAAVVGEQDSRQLLEALSPLAARALHE